MTGSIPHPGDAPVTRSYNESASFFEKLPKQFVTAIAKLLTSADRKALRLSSKTMQGHLDDVVKGDFKHLRCAVIYSELYALLRFTLSPLAPGVKSLTLGFLDSTTVKRDLEACRLSTNICLNVKNFLERRNGVEHFQTIFMLGHCRQMIADALEGLENLKTVSVVFKALPTLHNPLGSLPELGPHDYQNAFVQRMLELTTRPVMVRVYDPPKRWGCFWTGSEATYMSYATLLPPEELDDLKRESFLFPGMKWFCWYQGRYLTSLRLHNVGIPLQMIEMLFEDAGTLEVLSITESQLLEDAPFLAPAFSRPGSRLRKSLRTLSLRFCTADDDATRALPMLFKYFADDGQLENFLFEQVEGLWFDWNMNGFLDNGSHLSGIIAALGMKGALVRMLQCCRWTMTPRHPRLQQLFPL